MDSRTVKLPKAVYSEAALRKAATDYQGICKVEISNEGSNYACKVSNSVVDLTLTMNEYLNYLIEVSNSEYVNGSM